MKQQVNLPQTKRACGERRNEICRLAQHHQSSCLSRGPILVRMIALLLELREEEEEKTLTLFLTTPEGVGAKEKLSQILSFVVVEQVFSRVGDDYSPPHYV